MPRERVFTVVDRQTKEVRDTGLTAEQVVQQQLPSMRPRAAQEAATLAILRRMKMRERQPFGDIIVERTR